MQKYIEIVADTNDADYVSSRSMITDKEIEQIMPVIEAIRNFKPYKVDKVGYDKKSTWEHRHNWPNSDYIRADLGEKTTEELYGHLSGFQHFEELVPYGENGIHTIASITILTVVKEEKIL